jgi:hypothetical protein
MENWYSIHSVIRSVLRVTGLYGRGHRTAHDVRLRHNHVGFGRLPSAFDGFTILHISDYQMEYSRNLIFAVGGRMELVFQSLIDRSRAPLDLKTIKTILGDKRPAEIPPTRHAAAEWEVAVERPVYDLTVFKLHCGKLALKIYSKGERVLRIEAECGPVSGSGFRGTAGGNLWLDEASGWREPHQQQGPKPVTGPRLAGFQSPTPGIPDGRGACRTTWSGPS